MGNPKTSPSASPEIILEQKELDELKAELDEFYYDQEVGFDERLTKLSALGDKAYDLREKVDDLNLKEDSALVVDLEDFSSDVFNESALMELAKQEGRQENYPIPKRPEPAKPKVLVKIEKKKQGWREFHGNQRKRTEDLGLLEKDTPDTADIEDFEEKDRLFLLRHKSLLKVLPSKDKLKKIHISKRIPTEDATHRSIFQIGLKLVVYKGWYGRTANVQVNAEVYLDEYQNDISAAEEAVVKVLIRELKKKGIH